MSADRVETLRAMLLEQPQDTFLHYALATEYRLLGQSREALEQYNQILEIDPGYKGVYLHLASLYVETGDPDNARKTYLKGLMVTLANGDDHAYRELQAAYAGFEDWQDE